MKGEKKWKKGDKDVLLNTGNSIQRRQNHFYPFCYWITVTAPQKCRNEGEEEERGKGRQIDRKVGEQVVRNRWIDM